MSSLPVLIPVTLLLFAFLATLVSLRHWVWAQTAAVGGMVLTLALAVSGLVRVLSEGELRHHLSGWPPPFGIEYVLDPLAVFMTLVVVFVGMVVVTYPAQPGLYLAPRRGVPVYGLVLLLMAGLAGVIVTSDLFNLYVFLEIYSLATYGLITLGGNRATLASFRYIVLGTMGSGFYLLGVGFIYFSTGSLNMVDVAERLVPLYDSPAVIVAVGLIVMGLGVKMALFPLHVWLPDAHSYAPPVVAAILAAIQIKVAAYVLIRLLITVFQPDLLRDSLPITMIISWSAAVGIIAGSVMAIAQTDFKRMLAYSTVAQVAYIGLGIGLASPLGLTGAMLHIVGHAFMKSCLFLVAGGIIQQTGLQEIARFGGVGHRMPLMMAGFSIAAFSMIGVPPTAGFWSKWYLLLASLDAGNWVFVGVIIASTLLTAVYMFRLLEKVFTTPPDVEKAVKKAREPSAAIVGPILILAIGLIVIGLANHVIVTNLLNLVVARL